MKRVLILTMGKPTEAVKKTIIDLSISDRSIASLESGDISLKEGRFGIWYYQFKVEDCDFLFWQGVIAGCMLAASHRDIITGTD